jgi:hypothetical protein
VRCSNRLKPTARQSLSNALPRGVVPPFRQDNGRSGLSRKPIRYGTSPFTAALLNVERYNPKGHFDSTGLGAIWSNVGIVFESLRDLLFDRA